MAGFVVAFHWKPATYWGLTVRERAAIVNAQRKAVKR